MPISDCPKAAVPITADENNAQIAAWPLPPAACTAFLPATDTGRHSSATDLHDPADSATRCAAVRAVYGDAHRRRARRERDGRTETFGATMAARHTGRDHRPPPTRGQTLYTEGAGRTRTDCQAHGMRSRRTAIYGHTSGNRRAGLRGGGSRPAARPEATLVFRFYLAQSPDADPWPFAFIATWLGITEPAARQLHARAIAGIKRRVVATREGLTTKPSRGFLSVVGAEQFRAAHSDTHHAGKDTAMDMLGEAEVATMLGCSISTVRRRRDEGALPSYRFGKSRRFARADVRRRSRRADVSSDPPRRHVGQAIARYGALAR